MDSVLQEIADSIRYGDKARARELLEQVLRDDPSAQAYFYAAQLTDSPEAMKQQLRKALEMDPDFDLAQKALAALDDMPAAASPGTAPASAAPPRTAPQGTTPQPPAPKVARKEGKNTVYDAGTYEMLWDCKSCGTEKLLAKSQKFCPHCGAPQDPEWRYFPSDEEKVAVADHRYMGADKVCPNCGTLNAAAADYCVRCGAPQNEAAAVKLQATRTGQTFDTEDLDARQIREFDAQTGRVSGVTASYQAQKKKASGGFGVRQIAIIAVIVAVLGGIGYALFATQESSAIVTDFRWEREIDVEVFTAISDRAECGNEPGDAYNVDRRREQVGTRRVQDGETCTNRQVDQGDGTFRQERVCQPNYRSEPIMGYMCYYTVDRWVTDRTAEIDGLGLANVAWPLTNLRRSGSCLGCEREGQRRETYWLVFQGEGGSTFECEVDKALWESTTAETPFKIDVARVGGAPRCNTLERLN